MAIILPFGGKNLKRRDYFTENLTLDRHLKGIHTTTTTTTTNCIMKGSPEEKYDGGW
jgi:hypothetical protein